jgi:hypothetical protein
METLLSDGYSVTPTWRPALPLVVAGPTVAGVPVVEHGEGAGGVMWWWGTASVAGGRQPGQAAPKEKEVDRRRRWRGGPHSQTHGSSRAHATAPWGDHYIKTTSL